MPRIFSYITNHKLMPQKSSYQVDVTNFDRKMPRISVDNVITSHKWKLQKSSYQVCVTNIDKKMPWMFS